MNELDLLARLEKFLAALLISAGAVLGLATIILRYVFNVGRPWTPGVLVMLTVWGALFAGCAAVHDRSHLNIDVIVRRLPQRLHTASIAVSQLLVMTFAGILFVLGVEYWQFLFQSGSRSLVTYLPNWIAFSGLLVALLLIIIHSGYNALSTIRGIRR